MKRLLEKQTILLCAAMALSTSTLAQYAWVDENGVRQYSDRPPPASVPASRILKQPGSNKASIPADERPTSGQKTPSGDMSYTERNADFQRRRIQSAEKERKDAEREKLAEDNRRNCSRAREYQRNLESGFRIMTTDAQGEQVMLTDAQREHELKETRRIVAECDKTP